MGLPEHDLRGLLGSWGIGEIRAARTPATGTINETVILGTPAGERVLRAYRHRDRALVVAYRAVAPLDLAARDLAAAVYARKVAHDLWRYEDYYVGGNVRLGRFFQPGGFASPVDAWRTLRPRLSE